MKHALLGIALGTLCGFVAVAWVLDAPTHVHREPICDDDCLHAVDSYAQYHVKLAGALDARATEMLMRTMVEDFR